MDDKGGSKIAAFFEGQAKRTARWILKGEQAHVRNNYVRMCNQYQRKCERYTQLENLVDRLEQEIREVKSLLGRNGGW